MEDSDHDLIRAIGNGDHPAFERLVQRYQGLVLNFVARHMGDRHTAEDLAQEVFLRVYRAASGFEPRGKVKTWILKIAFNLCLNELKRLRRRRRLHDDLQIREMESGQGATVEATKGGEPDEDVLNALNNLTENQRAALLLRVNEGLSYAEIGGVLSLSVSSVESLIFRARTHLRKELRNKREE